jgi:hypothetical protein
MVKTMTVEVVSRVEIGEDGVLLLRLTSTGKPSYQYLISPVQESIGITNSGRSNFPQKMMETL